MSRIDAKITAAEGEPLGLAELLAELDAHTAATSPDRREAIACYLSASDGWRDASQRLGGAFTGEAGDPKHGAGKEP